MTIAARAWYGLTVVVVLVALVVQIPITASTTGGFFTTPAGRVGNLFCYFTIMSNLLTAVVSTVLAVRPTARSTLVRVLRLDAVLAMAVTGVVYHTLLAPLYDFEGAARFADILWHTVSPLLTVIGWLLFGPRGWLDRRTVAWSLAYPLAWLSFALVRGALIGWYPYPFIDVGVLGYPQVLLNAVGITVLFLVLALLVGFLDRWLPDRAGVARAPAAPLGG
ncbi:MAG: Pr6Pr family membrane protein [Pseudonocardia sp.]|nr:Pr6Pr family membrane protein [Pseudonocardia sp.]